MEQTGVSNAYCARREGHRASRARCSLRFVAPATASRARRYFSLDSNEKSEYKARELKVRSHAAAASTPIHCPQSSLTHRRAALCSCSQSVPINVHGTHLKLVIKSCHDNPLNVHRQVSIVALHVLGHPLTPLPPILLPPQPPSSSSLSHLSPPPTLPPELDLTTTQYLLHLSQLKAQAIDSEDYDTAKTMKERMERLMAEVPRLVEMEQRKREAIEREDYDAAKECKREVERIRERALLARPLPPDERKERAEALHRKKPSRELKPHPSDPAPPPSFTPRPSADDDRPIKPARSAATLPSAADDVVSAPRKSAGVPPTAADDDAAFPVHAADERPPASEQQAPRATQSAAYDEDRPIKTNYQSPPTDPTSPNGSRGHDAADDRALPSSNAAYPAFDSSGLPPSPSSSALPTAEAIPASLSKEAEPLLALFGSLLTSQLLSRHWQLRVEALSTIATLVADEASPVREGSSWLREVGRVLQRVMSDKVALVFVAGARLLEVVMKEAGRMKGAAGKEELKAVVEAVARTMVDRLSASNARERDQASQVLLYLALHRHSPPSTVPAALMHPLKKKDQDHPAPLRARLLLLHSLVLRFGLAEAAWLTLPVLMRFTVPLLSHRDAGVRDAAFNVVASACTESGGRGKVDGYLKDVPVGPLAGLEGRIEDVMDGVVVFAKVEAPTLAYVERPVAKDGAVTVAAAIGVSPRRPARRDDREEKERDEPPISARKEKPKRKQAASSRHTDAEPPLSARSNAAHDSAVGKKSPQPQRQAAKSDPPRALGGKEAQAKAKAKGPTASKGQKASTVQKASKLPPPPPPADSYADDEDEEYADDAAFDDSHSQADPSDQHLAVPNAGSPSQYRLTHATASPPSPVPESPAAPSSPPLSPLPTQCQFCGLDDPSFTEDALDLHYWQACPMLLSCPQCEQVVEIPTFAEHLTGECEGEGEWKACRRCGWVVEQRGVEEHERECGGVKEGSAVCQLCCKEVEGSDEGWRRHLLEEGCSGNARTAGVDTTAVASD